MKPLDKQKLRSITFKEFCDEALDKLNPSYDEALDLYISVFKEEIFVSLLNLRQKAERAKTYMNMFSETDVFLKVLSDFNTTESEIDLPAFERLLPVLRALNIKEDDSFLSAIAIFLHAKTNKGETQKSNQT